MEKPGIYMEVPDGILLLDFPGEMDGHAGVVLQWPSRSIILSVVPRVSCTAEQIAACGRVQARG